MEKNLIYKVYDFFNHMIHTSELQPSNIKKIKRCPVTGLDISMQSSYTKFLSVSGIKWYYKHETAIYYQFLSVRLSPASLNKDINTQFKLIAHSIRNAESNPRNNTKRAIQKLLNDKSSLFNNLNLIDKTKLQEAGIKKS